MRNAEIPVPPRDGLPIVGGRNVEILDDLVKRRRVRFGKRLRGILCDPDVFYTTVGKRLGRILDVAERVSYGHTLQRTLLGRNDADGLLEDRASPLKYGNVGVVIFNARHFNFFSRAVENDIANFKFGNRANDFAVHRIVNVGGDGGVIRRLLRRLGEIDITDRTVGARNLNLENLSRSVTRIERKRNHALLAASFFG